MRKGMLIGAIAGFLAGLLIQARGSLTTGMSVNTLELESAHLILMALGATFFIAALFGIIGAFLGAILQDLLEKR